MTVAQTLEVVYGLARKVKAATDGGLIMMCLSLTFPFSRTFALQDSEA